MTNELLPIGRHTMRTNDAKNVAIDFTKRFQVNADYGYIGYQSYFHLLGEEKKDQEVRIGKILRGRNRKFYRVIDTHFQEKELFRKFGEQLFQMPEYWYFYGGNIPKSEEIELEKIKISNESYELTLLSGNDKESLTLYNDIYINLIPYYSRWTAFCDFFRENDFENEKYLARLNDFRRELQKQDQFLGGNCIFFMESDHPLLENIETEHFSEFATKCRQAKEFSLLEISKFLTDKKYRDNLPFSTESSLIFFDDFSDLR